MTTPGLQGEVSPESMGKTAFSAVGGPSDAKPAPSGAAEKTVDRSRLKPLSKAIVRSMRVLEAESQNGKLRLNAYVSLGKSFVAQRHTSGKRKRLCLAQDAWS